MNKKKIIAGTGIVLAAVLILLWIFIFEGKTQDTADTGSQNLQGVTAVPGSVAIKVEGPSVAEPNQIQTIRSALEGVIVSVKQEGAVVTKGSILAALDESDKQTAIEQAKINFSKAALAKDKSSYLLKNALEDLEGKKKLFSKGALSADQVVAAQRSADSARYALKSAELDLSQAKLALETAGNDLQNTTITSPFNGIILTSELLPGDMVTKGTPIITVADLSKIKLTAEIDELDIGKIKEGQKVSITSDSLGDKILTSKVYSISPAAEVVNNISIFKVSSIIDNDEGILKPGMSADISILIKSDRGLIVPSKAVSRVRTRSYIKVLKDGKITTKKIKTGADNGINVVVLDGLEDGDVVVVEGVPGFSLSTSTAASGNSVIPISIPGVRK